MQWCKVHHCIQYSDINKKIFVLKFSFYFVFTFLASIFHIYHIVYFENQCVSVTVLIQKKGNMFIFEWKLPKGNLIYLKTVITVHINLIIPSSKVFFSFHPLVVQNCIISLALPSIGLDMQQHSYYIRKKRPQNIGKVKIKIRDNIIRHNTTFNTVLSISQMKRLSYKPFISSLRARD